MRIDDEERGAIPGLCQMRRSLAGKKEAGEMRHEAGGGGCWQRSKLAAT
jgi:hypothetical protein